MRFPKTSALIVIIFLAIFANTAAALTWQNNQTNIASSYSQTASVFNVTWTGASNVEIEGNWSGSAAKYTMISLGSGVYGYSNILPAGTFYWKSYASSGNTTNQTDAWLFTISKATPIVSLQLDGVAANKNYDKYSTANLAATIDATPAADISIIANYYGQPVVISSGLTTATNITALQNLALGNYRINASFSGNQNYTAASVAHTLTVTDMTPPKVSHIAIVPCVPKPGSTVSLIGRVSDTISSVASTIARIYNSTNDLIYTSSNLGSDGWTLSFTASNTTGDYYINITVSDTYGNTNNTRVKEFSVDDEGATITAINNSFIANTHGSFDATTLNVTLDVETNSSVTNGTISLAAYNVNPVASCSYNSINKYLEIIASHDLTNSLKWAIIKIYYNHSEFGSKNESSLRIYREDGGSWSAIDSGVNTAADYVWANVSHFSIYGVFVMPYCGDATCNSGDGETCSSCPADCTCATTTTTTAAASSSIPSSITDDTTQTTTTTTEITQTTTTTTAAVTAENLAATREQPSVINRTNESSAAGLSFTGLVTFVASPVGIGVVGSSIAVVASSVYYFLFYKHKGQSQTTPGKSSPYAYGSRMQRIKRDIMHTGDHVKTHADHMGWHVGNFFGAINTGNLRSRFSRKDAAKTKSQAKPKPQPQTKTISKEKTSEAKQKEQEQSRSKPKDDSKQGYTYHKS